MDLNLAIARSVSQLIPKRYQSRYSVGWPCYQPRSVLRSEQNGICSHSSGNDFGSCLPAPGAIDAVNRTVLKLRYPVLF